MASSGNTSFKDKLTSLPSLEALMSDLYLFEELLLKDLDKEVFSSLCAVYLGRQ